MASRATVLVVDEDISAHESTIKALSAHYYMHTAENCATANEVLKQEWVQVIVCNMNCAGGNNLSWLSDVHMQYPDTRIVLFDATDDISTDQLSKAGVYAQLQGPATCANMLRQYELTIQQGVELFQLARDNQRLSLELSIRPKNFSQEIIKQRQLLQTRSEWDQGIVRSGQSTMNDVCDMIEHVAPFDVNVVFCGQSGTGKELCARAVHNSSLRRQGPFIAENCGALPDELLASELFGHKKGAFTGAVQDNDGLFLQANGGTLFLDEVGELSANFQVKLLRVLQEGIIRPVGSNSYQKVDVRIVAATNRDLTKEVQEGRFREDLYYRLATFVITLPSLKERRCDVATLAHVILQDSMSQMHKRVKGFAQDTLKIMQQYSWPGNVRELENEIKRMLVLAHDQYLTPNLLSGHIQMAAQLSPAPDHASEQSLLEQSELSESMRSGSLKDRVESLESRILQETLARHRWNKTRAANELGLSRVGLRNKLERYSLEVVQHVGRN